MITLLWYFFKHAEVHVTFHDKSKYNLVLLVKATITNYKSLAHVVMEMSQNVPKLLVIEVAASTVIHYYLGCT